MNRVVVAIDSFKECLPSREIEIAAMRGVLRATPNAHVEIIPISDGGEFFLDAWLSDGAPNRRIPIRAVDAMMRPIISEIALCHEGKTAVIESAQTIGLQKIAPHERAICQASSFGLGMAIRHAVKLGAETLLIGLGGSATCDGGLGLLEALGAKIALDRFGFPISIDMSHFIQDFRHIHVFALCDVDNPLIGSDGAARVFAPQKGATPTQVEWLEERHLHLLECSKRDAPVFLDSYERTGAAGGIAFALRAFLRAQTLSGIDAILEHLQFDRRLAGSDFVITGEGKADTQTRMGKAPIGILRRAQKQGIPTALIAGICLTPHAFIAEGFSEACGIHPAQTDPNTYLDPDVTKRDVEQTVYEILLRHR